jgi:hypothetical protein
MVGLSNVDDTSDANKPVSTSVQTALDQSTLKFANINRTTVSSNTQTQEFLMTNLQQHL